VSNFTLIWGFRPQNNEKLPKLPTFPPAGENPLPDVGEICRIYAGNRSTEVINIWYDSVGKLGICRQKKTAMGHFPPKFSESPSSQTAGSIEKKSCGAKMVGIFSIFMQSLVDIRRCTAD